MARIVLSLVAVLALLGAGDGAFVRAQEPVAAQETATTQDAGAEGQSAPPETSVIEPLRTRDHTEIALREFGADVTVDKLRISVAGRPVLRGRQLSVPGDISSAAFFLVAALLVPGSSLVIEGVGLNPTRAALLDFLIAMGGKIRVRDIRQNQS